MSSSKQIDLKRDFAAGVYMTKAQNPIPPPPHSVYVYTVCLVIQARRGGGELNQREGERGNRGQYRSQSSVENTNMTERISSL
jgi:hypothetical protein